MSKICTKCGSEMDDSAKFCPECGAPAPVKAQENTPAPTQDAAPAPVQTEAAAAVSRTTKKGHTGVLSVVYFVAAAAVVLYALTYHLPQFLGAPVLGIFVMLLMIAAMGGIWFGMGKLAGKGLSYTKLLVFQIVAFVLTMVLFLVAQTGNGEVMAAKGLNNICKLLFSGIVVCTFLYLIAQTFAERKRGK